MIRPAVLLVVLCLALSACAGRSADATVRHPGILTWGVVGSDVSTLDPALASDPTSISVSSLIYGGLVRFDRRLNVRPDGASHWSIGSHGTRYTFYLRHDLRFPDGRSVTAANFVQALQRSMGPESAAGTAPFYLGQIRRTKTGPSVQAIGRWTLTIKLSRPSAGFLSELAFPSSFVPDPRRLSRYGQDWTSHAAGFGPYEVASWEHGRDLVLRRNPHYFGGVPRFRRIVLRFYPDARSALAAYRQGSIQLLSGLAPGAILPRGLPGATRVRAEAMDYVAFNTLRAPLSALSARRALSGIDVSSVSSIMGRSAFPRSTRGSAFAARNLSSNVGLHLTFVIPRDPQIYALANALARAWTASLHAHIAVRKLNLSNYDTVLGAHAFDLALIRWAADYPDPADFLSTQLGSSPDNVTGWNPPAFDRLMHEATVASGAQSRRSALAAASRLVASQVPILPLDDPSISAALEPTLHGVHLTGLGTIQGTWAHAGFGG
ncbi:MAG: ABC transporter substrate-binding protein [Chloroflexota bacterium]